MKKLCSILILSFGFFIPQVHAQSGHEVDLTIVNSSCNTSLACTAQVYRASGSCPASGIGSLTYTQIGANVPAATSTSTNQTFTYADTAPIVANANPGTQFCYYATNTYTTGTGGPSLPSNTFQGTIPGPTTPPSASTITGTVK